MADGRMLKKKISTSRRLAALKTDSARLLYTWLIPHLDIEGRFSADPAVVKGQIVPRLKHLTEEKVNQILIDMAQNELIYMYSNDGDRFLELRHFRDEQNIREDRERQSTIPAPDQCEPLYPGELPENSRRTPAEVKLSKVKLSKYREQVKMTEEQYNKLVEKYGAGSVSLFLDKLNNYKEETGKRYKSDYHAILNWVVNAVLGDDKGPKGGTPIKCKECGVTGVYINDEGYCAVCESKSTRGSKK